MAEARLCACDRLCHGEEIRSSSASVDALQSVIQCADRATTCTRVCDRLLKESGVEPVIVPPRSRHLNTYCERCVCSINEEALDGRLRLGARSQQEVIHQDVTHDSTACNHQGLHHQRSTAASGIES
jgi:hypothetical protein